MPEGGEFIYRLKVTRLELLSEGPTPGEQDCVSRHFAYLQDQARRGTVLLAGRILVAGRRSFGIVILRAESEEEAARIMRGDPAVQEGVMRAELFPFRIALANCESR